MTLTKSNRMVQKYGIGGVRFEGDASDFDNGTLYPEYSCYTYQGKAMPSGVR